MLSLRGAQLLAALQHQGQHQGQQQEQQQQQQQRDSAKLWI